MSKKEEMVNLDSSPMRLLSLATAIHTPSPSTLFFSRTCFSERQAVRVVRLRLRPVALNTGLTRPRQFHAVALAVCTLQFRTRPCRKILETEPPKANAHTLAWNLYFPIYKEYSLQPMHPKCLRSTLMSRGILYSRRPHHIQSPMSYSHPLFCIRRHHGPPPLSFLL